MDDPRTAYRKTGFLAEDMASVKETSQSAHKRINKIDRITSGIHEIAAGVQTLALQVKLTAEKMDENTVQIQNSLKTQGERIAALEKEPATKWKTLTAQVLGLVVAAIVGVVIIHIRGVYYVQKEFKKKLAALINVKTIITFLVGGVFTFKAVTGGLSADYIVATVNMILAFYFGRQKQKQEDSVEK